MYLASSTGTYEVSCGQYCFQLGLWSPPTHDSKRHSILVSPLFLRQDGSFSLVALGLPASTERTQKVLEPASWYWPVSSDPYSHFSFWSSVATDLRVPPLNLCTPQRVGVARLKDPGQQPLSGVRWASLRPLVCATWLIHLSSWVGPAPTRTAAPRGREKIQSVAVRSHTGCLLDLCVHLLCHHLGF